MACSAVSCRFVFKLGIVGASVFIFLQYVFGVAVYAGLRSWHGQLTYDVHVRRLLERVTWEDVNDVAPTNRIEQTTLNVQACPIIPPRLKGPITVDNVSTPSFESLAAQHPELELGGLWRPSDCRSRHHVAIVIPYRQRETHLKIFLNNMHPFLQRQQLDYGIYVVDEALPTRFNRAMLMNIGYAEASKQANYSCYIFHDVDLLPQDDRNLYGCPDTPRHMSAAIDKYHYRLVYSTIFGGVTAFKTEHFKLINGFSNKFFGWGGEDDDLRTRVGYHGLPVARYPMAIARYTMVKHTRDVLNAANRQRLELLRHTKERLSSDGLNSLHYELVKLEKRPLYTWLNVRIHE